MTDSTLLIRDVPLRERPRERMRMEGPQSLSNQEILAIMLRTGTKNESVLQLAQHVLAHFDGLPLLKEATVEELCQIRGIGDAKAVEICAAIELGRRMHSMQNEDRYVIRSPEDASRYVMEDMRFLQQEHFVCTYFT